MERNIAIDTLRTVSTLLVILLHISAEYVIKSMNDFTFDSSFWISNIVDSFSRICVPLFVLISGMFLVGRNETFEQSYQKRASRILIPLIAWTIIYLLYRMSISFVVSNIIDIKSLFVSVILGCPFYHMWYLFMIIGLYLITPLLNNSISKISRNNLWIVAILFLLFGMVNSCYDEFFNNNVFFMLWFINYLGYFILGYLIKDYKKRFPFYFLFSVYIISSILIAFLSLYTIKTYHNLFFYGYLTPFVVFGALSFYKLFHQLKLVENIFSRISHLTLGIYLIHAGVLDVLKLILRVLEINSLNDPIIGIPIKFIIAFFVSTLVAWIITKIKYIRRII